MKKKLIFFITLLVASVLFVPNAFAATTPELVKYGTKQILIANGTEITIEATSEAGYTAVAKYDGGQILLPADTTVIGGTHNSTEKVNTKITVNGGTVKNVFGGGLHKSSVGTAEIIVNGGTITGSIMGGGYEEFVDCGLGDFNIVTEANVMTSTTKVEKANITVNGGTLEGALVFGGGGAHSYTGEAKITLNDFEGKIAYLTAGGSNGYTGDAEIIMNGGAAEVLQSVNRGTMDTISIEINGGTVTNAYAGGETDPTVTGTFEDAYIVITGGKVTNLEVGSNGVNANDKTSISAKDNVVVEYNKDAVTNVDEEEFAEDSIVKTVTLTFVAEDESLSIQVPVGFKLTAEDVEDLKEEIAKELGETGYKFEGFYSDKELKTAYDMTTEFTEDVTVYLNFVEEAKTDTTKNPDTSDISLYGTIIAILLATAGLGYTIKKRRFN